MHDRSTYGGGIYGYSIYCYKTYGGSIYTSGRTAATTAAAAVSVDCSHTQYL
jgi:hypothetical protein